MWRPIAFRKRVERPTLLSCDYPFVEKNTVEVSVRQYTRTKGLESALGADMQSNNATAEAIEVDITPTGVLHDGF